MVAGPGKFVSDGERIILGRSGGHVSPRMPYVCPFCLSFGYVLKVDKPVHSGDKGQETFKLVREILSK